MLRDFARRLLFSRSTAYFLVSFLSACCQVILRTALFVTDNAGARREGVSVWPASQLQNVTGLFRIQHDGRFEFCSDVPHYCQSPPPNFINTCDALAIYSMNLFRDNRLEDVVFIVIHTYLICVTIYALARESIPHIIFIFAIRCLSVLWAFARVIETFIIQKTLIGTLDGGQCKSESAFFGSSFFSSRHIFEGLLLGVSVLSVSIESFVALKLGRIYSERPWRVVQVSSEMRKMYRLLLGFSVVAQMAGLILPATMALWLDQLLNTYFWQIAGSHKYIYGAFFLAWTLLLPMWIALGWFALRREWKKSTIVFFSIGTVFICSFIAGLGSAMFTWAVTTWWFFGTMYAASLALLLAATVLAVICRRNFGKNLDHYLLVQSRLSSMNFTHAHFDKDIKQDEAEIPQELEKLDTKSDYETEYWGYETDKHFAYD